jgi:fructose-1-phosphate kinase PfkB-like protein
MPMMRLTGCARRTVGARDALVAGGARGFSPTETESRAAAAGNTAAAVNACATTTAGNAYGTAAARLTA